MGTINSIQDLQKVFGDKPLNSVYHINSKPSNLSANFKVGLYVVVGTLAVVGLYTIFKTVHEMNNVRDNNERKKSFISAAERVDN